jgi:hypothetical protein
MRERTVRIARASGAEGEIAAVVVALLSDGLGAGGGDGLGASGEDGREAGGEDGREAGGEETLGGGEEERGEEVLFEEKGEVRCERAEAGRGVKPMEEREVNVFQWEREDRAHFWEMVYSSGCGAEGSVN